MALSKPYLLRWAIAIAMSLAMGSMAVAILWPILRTLHLQDSIWELSLWPCFSLLYITFLYTLPEHCPSAMLLLKDGEGKRHPVATFLLSFYLLPCWILKAVLSHGGVKEIVPNQLFVAHHGAQLHPSSRRPAVLDVAMEFEADSQLVLDCDYLCVPTLLCSTIDEETFCNAVLWAARRYQEGQPVYIFSGLGYNRATVIACALLVYLKLVNGTTMHEAVSAAEDWVRSRHPRMKMLRLQRYFIISALQQIVNKDFHVEWREAGAPPYIASHYAIVVVGYLPLFFCQSILMTYLHKGAMAHSALMYSVAGAVVTVGYITAIILPIVEGLLHGRLKILQHPQARLFLYSILCDFTFVLFLMISSILRLWSSQDFEVGWGCSLFGLVAQCCIACSLSYTFLIGQDLLLQVYDPFKGGLGKKLHLLPLTSIAICCALYWWRSDIYGLSAAHFCWIAAKAPTGLNINTWLLLFIPGGALLLMSILSGISLRQCYQNYPNWRKDFFAFDLGQRCVTVSLFTWVPFAICWGVAFFTGTTQHLLLCGAVLYRVIVQVLYWKFDLCSLRTQPIGYSSWDTLAVAAVNPTNLSNYFQSNIGLWVDSPPLGQHKKWRRELNNRHFYVEPYFLSLTEMALDDDLRGYPDFDAQLKQFINQQVSQGIARRIEQSLRQLMQHMREHQGTEKTHGLAQMVSGWDETTAAREVWGVDRPERYFYLAFRRTFWYKYVVTRSQYKEALDQVFPFVRITLWHQLLVIWKSQPLVGRPVEECSIAVYNAYTQKVQMQQSFLQSIKQDYITAVEYMLFHIALRLPPPCNILVPGDAQGNNFQAVPGFPCATYNDYGRAIFGEIQALLGITRGSYQASICKLAPIQHAGGSGVTMLMTHDHRYIIKQITKSEKEKLIDMLEEYYHHIKASAAHGGSSICCILGCHAIRMAPARRQAVTIFLVVMQNAEYIPALGRLGRVQLKVDLKGSWIHRRSGPPGMVDNALRSPAPSLDQRIPTAKDLDLMDCLFAPAVQCQMQRLPLTQLLTSLAADVKFFTSHNVMDYSLLLLFFEDADPQCYVIDYLQDFNCSKRAETLFKALRYGRKKAAFVQLEGSTFGPLALGVSSCPPTVYGRRFLNNVGCLLHNRPLSLDLRCLEPVASVERRPSHASADEHQPLLSSFEV